MGSGRRVELAGVGHISRGPRDSTQPKAINSQVESFGAANISRHVIEATANEDVRMGDMMVSLNPLCISSLLASIHSASHVYGAADPPALTPIKTIAPPTQGGLPLPLDRHMYRGRTHQRDRT